MSSSFLYGRPQWDKDALETAGLIKIEVVGLRMLAALSEAERLLAEQGTLLTQQFGLIVRERSDEAFSPWLEGCRSSSIGELVTFAEGLQREEPIIRAALEQAYSNGVTEGHVNRLKMIKRTAYGRASFELLRRRVLAAA